MPHTIDPDGQPYAPDRLARKADIGALDPDGTVRLLQLEDGVAPGAPVA